MMRFVSIACVGLLVVTLLEGARAENKDAQLEASELDDLENDRAAKLIAYHTTKTKAVFATTTTFALSTCYSITNTPACTGRKKRNVMINPKALDDGLDDDLSSSLDDSYKRSSLGDAPPANRKAKNFTFWSTVFSTYTVTSTEFIQGTTVTVSAVCSIAGQVQACTG